MAKVEEESKTSRRRTRPIELTWSFVLSVLIPVLLGALLLAMSVPLSPSIGALFLQEIGVIFISVSVVGIYLELYLFNQHISEFTAKELADVLSSRIAGLKASVEELTRATTETHLKDVLARLGNNRIGEIESDRLEKQMTYYAARPRIVKGICSLTMKKMNPNSRFREFEIKDKWEAKNESSLEIRLFRKARWIVVPPTEFSKRKEDFSNPAFTVYVVDSLTGESDAKYLHGPSALSGKDPNGTTSGPRIKISFHGNGQSREENIELIEKQPDSLSGDLQVYELSNNEGVALPAGQSATITYEASLCLSPQIRRYRHFFNDYADSYEVKFKTEDPGLKVNGEPTCFHPRSNPKGATSLNDLCTVDIPTLIVPGDFVAFDWGS